MKIPAINRDSKLAFYIGDLTLNGRQEIIEILSKDFKRGFPMDVGTRWISLNFGNNRQRLGKSTSNFNEAVGFYKERGCTIIRIKPK